MFIFWIAFVSVFIVISSLIMVKLSDKFSFDAQTSIQAICFVLFIVGIVGIITTPIMGYKYLTSQHKAIIINQEFGTNYTAKDIFYAEDVIEEIRQMKRQRIELNGNILNKKGE